MPKLELILLERYAEWFKDHPLCSVLNTSRECGTQSLIPRDVNNPTGMTSRAKNRKADAHIQGTVCRSIVHPRIATDLGQDGGHRKREGFDPIGKLFVGPH